VSRGVVLGLSAYLIWGLSPLFWKQVDDVGALDLIAVRVVATAVVLVGVHLLVGSLRRVVAAAADRRTRLVALATASLLVVNWLVFVWAVGDDRVLEASLGYFVNPLVSVVLGVVVLRERLRTGQWAAVALATVGVVWLTVDVGTLPWVSLTLAGTFGLYGLLRKTASVESLDGLSLEIGLLVPLAAVVLALGWAGGDGVDLSGPGRDAWFLATGLITAAPLLLFAAAARRVELSVVGILQYVAPTLQFLIGTLVYDEPWRGGQVVGYVIIWVALAGFALEGLTVGRRAGGVPRLRPAVGRAPTA
jgi:chloramphenicol-sensitive protein RarD